MSNADVAQGRDPVAETAGPCDDSCGTTSADAVPIACSLSGTGMAERVEEWQRILEGVSRRRPVPGGVRLDFGDRSALADLAALVGAEQACCPFFSFTITLDQHGLALAVTAPADGHDLLTAVFGDAEGPAGP